MWPQPIPSMRMLYSQAHNAEQFATALSKQRRLRVQ
jgi:hypothetical protein